MASKREQVLAAVTLLVRTALPFADVRRNGDAGRIGPGGTVIVRDGEPGDPEVDLSPLVYHYEHRIPLEIAAYGSSEVEREVALDRLMTAIGDGVGTDRTLGGLCDWLEAEAPDTDDIEVMGAETGRWADAAIVASYAALSPLN